MSLPNRIELPCTFCAKLILIKHSVYKRSTTKRFFCNQVCSGRWRSDNIKGENHPNHKTKIEVQCAGTNCTNTKLVYPSQARDREVFFCSSLCKSNWHRIHDAGPRKWMTVSCAGPGCTKSVSLVKSRADNYNAHFCSAECEILWRSEQSTGNKNPNYRGGYQSKCAETSCNNLVWIAPADVDKQRFCSKKCSDKFFVGFNAPAWRGGMVQKRCLICDSEFEIKRAEEIRNSVLYCSQKCWGVAASRIRTKIRTNEEVLMRRLNRNMGARILESLGASKAGRHWENLVNYTLAELVIHLESLFTEGMTWENRGVYKRGGPLRWHIDHIRPKSSFSFSSPDDPQFLECWGLANLQPLWGPDNSVKSDDWDGWDTLSISNL